MQPGRGQPTEGIEDLLITVAARPGQQFSRHMPGQRLLCRIVTDIADGIYGHPAVFFGRQPVGYYLGPGRRISAGNTHLPFTGQLQQLAIDRQTRLTIHAAQRNRVIVITQRKGITPHVQLEIWRASLVTNPHEGTYFKRAGRQRTTPSELIVEHAAQQPQAMESPVVTGCGTHAERHGKGQVLTHVAPDCRTCMHHRNARPLQHILWADAGQLQQPGTFQSTG